MPRTFRRSIFLFLSLFSTAVYLIGCHQATSTPTAVAPTEPAATPTAVLPQITAVTVDRPTLPRYESLEMAVALTAVYTNPFDARQISLDAVFTAPDGQQQQVPGFWDGRDSWRIRFTPSQVGDWQYEVVVNDSHGRSLPHDGQFTVTASAHHGWLQPGNWVDPAYSGRYLVHHDGTPFYGLGHADALNILIDGFDADEGVGLFNQMVDAGENYVVWWPLYSNSPLTSYDQYAIGNLNLIDTIVQDAQKKGIYLIFTIWDHPQLRDDNHAWGTGNWARNGFSKLGSIEQFFTDAEAWAWQENLYRYLIARWGYSPAIGMWQTVSEINGTNAYEQTDIWHKKVTDYFVQHDPYRHPTTASMAGDVDWAAGHAAMDAPQVHVYALEEGAVKAADVIAYWTQTMWHRAEKPNWIGEFGVGGNSQYPELFHNAIWAGLASGAAMTPAEWNSGGVWERMTPEMLADLARLGDFVDGLPLAAWNPQALEIRSSDTAVRGWGIAGEAGGLFWIQDFALEGQSIEAVRADDTIRQGVQLELVGLAAGSYTIHPYDSWQGVWGQPLTAVCSAEQACLVDAPDFQADIAFKIERNP